MKAAKEQCILSTKWQDDFYCLSFRLEVRLIFFLILQTLEDRGTLPVVQNPIYVQSGSEIMLDYDQLPSLTPPQIYVTAKVLKLGSFTYDHKTHVFSVPDVSFIYWQPF